MISNRSKVVVVGSHAPGMFVRVKRTPKPGETVIGWNFHEPVDGGKGSNQAIAVALLGTSVSFVGCVGKDRIGDDGERWMREAGVDTSFLRRSETTSSGVGFIMLDEDGVPAMVTSMGANAALSMQEIDAALSQLAEASVMLTQFEIDPKVSLYAARTAREHGMTSIVNPAPAPETPITGLDSATILIPNETEAKVLLGFDSEAEVDPKDLASDLYNQSGVNTVIITVGENGVVGADKTGIWHLNSPHVKVIDTSGAGDVFCASLAVRLVSGDSIKTAAEWACYAASLSVTRPGTIPAFPTLDEVNNFISRIKH